MKINIPKTPQFGQVYTDMMAGVHYVFSYDGWVKLESVPIEKIYAFEYCPCIHESSYGVVSLHRTRKGAEIAMEFHRNALKTEYDVYHKYIIEDLPDYPYSFGKFERWKVVEIEIQD